MKYHKELVKELVDAGRGMLDRFDRNRGKGVRSIRACRRMRIAVCAAQETMQNEALQKEVKDGTS